MHQIGVLVAAAVGFEWGYQPTGQGEMEYIIQLRPAEMRTLLENRQPLISYIPPEVQPIRSVRIVVGEGPVARAERAPATLQLAGNVRPVTEERATQAVAVFPPQIPGNQVGTAQHVLRETRMNERYEPFPRNSSVASREVRPPGATGSAQEIRPPGAGGTEREIRPPGNESRGGWEPVMPPALANNGGQQSEGREPPIVIPPAGQPDRTNIVSPPANQRHPGQDYSGQDYTGIAPPSGQPGRAMVTPPADDRNRPNMIVPPEQQNWANIARQPGRQDRPSVVPPGNQPGRGQPDRGQPGQGAFVSQDQGPLLGPALPEPVDDYTMPASRPSTPFPERVQPPPFGAANADLADAAKTTEQDDSQPATSPSGDASVSGEAGPEQTADPKVAESPADPEKELENSSPRLTVQDAVRWVAALAAICGLVVGNLFQWRSYLSLRRRYLSLLRRAGG